MPPQKTRRGGGQKERGRTRRRRRRRCSIVGDLLAVWYVLFFSVKRSTCVETHNQKYLNMQKFVTSRSRESSFCQVHWSDDTFSRFWWMAIDASPWNGSLVSREFRSLHNFKFEILPQWKWSYQNQLQNRLKNMFSTVLSTPWKLLDMSSERMVRTPSFAFKSSILAVTAAMTRTPCILRFSVRPF